MSNIQYSWKVYKYCDGATSDVAWQFSHYLRGESDVVNKPGMYKILGYDSNFDSISGVATYNIQLRIYSDNPVLTPIADISVLVDIGPRRDIFGQYDYKIDWGWGAIFREIANKVRDQYNQPAAESIMDHYKEVIYNGLGISPKTCGDLEFNDRMVQKRLDMIKSITINKNKSIITTVFNDGDVRMSKCSEHDNFDVYVGVAMCIAAHYAGSKTKFKKLIDSKTSKQREDK